jgi:hypothetical protein
MTTPKTMVKTDTSHHLNMLFPFRQNLYRAAAAQHKKQTAKADIKKFRAEKIILKGIPKPSSAESSTSLQKSESTQTFL